MKIQEHIYLIGLELIQFLIFLEIVNKNGRIETWNKDFINMIFMLKMYQNFWIQFTKKFRDIHIFDGNYIYFIPKDKIKINNPKYIYIDLRIYYIIYYFIIKLFLFSK